jgi:hypothetical protein
MNRGLGNVGQTAKAVSSFTRKIQAVCIMHQVWDVESALTGSVGVPEEGLADLGVDLLVSVAFLFSTDTGASKTMDWIMLVVVFPLEVEPAGAVVSKKEEDHLEEVIIRI